MLGPYQRTRFSRNPLASRTKIMALDNRRQSQFPDRGPTVKRNRGFSGWGDTLTRLKSNLERMEAAQKKREHSQTRKKRANTGTRGGKRLFRTLLIMAVILYGLSRLSEPLFEFVYSWGDLESLLSGNGDELLDRFMAEREAAARRVPKPSVPTSQAPRLPQTGTAAPAPQPQPVTAPATRIADLPRYPGAKPMLEDQTVGVYVTADPVPQVADTTFALLQKAGWRGRLTAQDPEMRHLTFTRGNQELTAYISIAPRLGNRTSIQYHIVK